MNLKFTKKSVVIAGSLIVCASVLLYLLYPDSGDVNYIFRKVQITEVEKRVSISGSLDITRNYILRAEDSATVVSVKVRLNDKISKGKLIAELDMPEVEYEYQSSKEALTRAKLDLDSAESRFRSQQHLKDENLISPNEYAHEQRTLERVRSAYRSALLQYKRSLDRYSRRLVISPSAGTVFQMNLRQDIEIKPGYEMAVIVPDMTKLNLVITVDESDIGNIRKGQAVTFAASAYARKKFKGTIAQIDMNPRKAGNITTYQAYVDCNNAEGLLYPGMNVTGYVHVAKKQNVLAVPVEALFIAPMPIEKKPGEQIVWVKQGKSFRKVRITSGLMGDSYVEVKGGSLKPGEEVLVAISRGEKKTGVRIVQ